MPKKIIPKPGKWEQITSAKALARTKSRPKFLRPIWCCSPKERVRQDEFGWGLSAQ
jgi:hypothetical protein